MDTTPQIESQASTPEITPKRISFNANRVYQATALLPYLRRDGLGSNERAVLLALSARMAFETSKRNSTTIVDTCFPSLQFLVNETMISDRSVRRAVDNLIQCGFITKTQILGYKLHKGPGQGKFFHNRYYVVPALWDSVGSPFKKKAPVQHQAPVSDPSDHLDTSITDPALAPPPSKAKYAATKEIVDLLRLNFSRHSTFARPDAGKIVASAVRRCIDQAGSGERCLEILKWMLSSLKRCDHLGGYLPIMLGEYGPPVVEEVDEPEAEEVYEYPSRMKDDDEF